MMSQRDMVEIAKEKCRLFIGRQGLNISRDGANRLRSLMDEEPEMMIKFTYLLWQEGYRDCQKDLSAFMYSRERSP